MKLLKNKNSDAGKHLWSCHTGKRVDLKPGEAKELSEEDLALFEKQLSEDKELEVLERLSDVPVERPRLEVPRPMPKGKKDEKDLSEVVEPKPTELKKLDE